MNGRAMAIYIHERRPVDGAKVEANGAPFGPAPLRGQHKRASIARARRPAQRATKAKAAHLRLDSKRHACMALERFADGLRSPQLLPLPPTVERAPTRALQLRPRVLRKWCRLVEGGGKPALERRRSIVHRDCHRGSPRVHLCERLGSMQL